MSLKGTKEAKEVRVKATLSTPVDEVRLSKTAEAYVQPTASTSEYDKEQSMKVERLKSLVNSGHYEMNEQTVNTIAERIANMLL